MPSLGKKPLGVRWAKVSEIDRRTSVGSPAWVRRHPPRVRRLSAWRRLHMFGGHGPVRVLSRKLGAEPSSRLRTRQMVNGIKQLKRAQNLS